MKLVGSSSAVRSPEFHKRKERERAFKVAALAILIVLLLATPVFVLRSQKFVISKVAIEGNNVTRDEDIERIVSERISGYYLRLIPKASSFFSPQGGIEESLMESIPRLSSVEASLEGMNTLLVKVAEREPFALYCENVSDYQSPSGCFFVDETGSVFSEAPIFSGDVYMIYSMSPLLENPLRSEISAEEEFKSVTRFVSRLPKLGLEPKVVMRNGHEYALTLKGGTELKWLSGQDLERLASDLESFLRDSEIKTAAFGDLLYLDLRFDNKVFYKFRNE